MIIFKSWPIPLFSTYRSIDLSKEFNTMLSERTTIVITVIFIMLILSVIGFEGYHYYNWNYTKEAYLIGPEPSYNLLEPEAKYVMPKELQEISGIAYLSSDKMACIQDEDGILFIYDLSQRRLDQKITFANSGDYEDLEIVGKQVNVLESKGNIYQFILNDDSIGTVTKIKTALSKKNNCEGLGFDATTNQLLIACKEDGDIKDNDIKGRSVYGFSLDTNELIMEPRYVITPKSYNNALDKDALDKKKHKPFKPSAIAIHPFTKEIYIIASVGRMMVILSPQGKLEQLIPLKTSIMKQPEGLCFDMLGNLYICSEGGDDNGYILKFRKLGDQKD